MDADWDDWPRDDFAFMDSSDYVAVQSNGMATEGDGDISAYWAFAWTADALHLLVAVADDVARNAAENAGCALWRGDSLQLGLDMDNDDADGSFYLEDYELGWARVGTMDQSCRWSPLPNSFPLSTTFAYARTGTTTVYEVSIPASVIGRTTLAAGDTFGFCVVVNDDDGTGRVGLIQTTPGVGLSKAPSLFGTLTLAP